MSRYAIIEAPSPLGLWPSGIEHAPEVLLKLGLARALNARPDRRVEPPEYDPVRDAVTQMLNPRGLAEYSPRLADAVGAVLDKGEFPVVLGGDCSILLGCTLALRRRGRYGLLFLDGHADFYQPEASPTGEAADMDLGLVSGRGPDAVVNLEGRKPYARDEDIVVFGQRDAAMTFKHGSRDVRATGMTVLDLIDVRKAGAKTAAAAAVAKLTAVGSLGFWIHLDVDVLDDAIMPAVDYRMTDGLDFDELVAVLQTATGTGRAVGLDITIFNPNLDPDRTVARRLVDALRQGLAVEAA
ncbi:MAG: arginase family protein [Methyloceanibacter sp.]|uniref:arginase family protein n=1 Tax=Methyloceanibacter sp. TaxID=1965321 RepID=UPI003D6D332E